MKGTIVLRNAASARRYSLSQFFARSGGSQPLSASRTLNINTPLTNTAVASGTSGGAAVSAQATATVSPRLPRIALELEGSLADVCAGSDVEVTYGYKVTNTGYYSTASGTLVDDNGTPADAADDFTVGSWGPLAPGASQTLSASRTINISAPLTHTAVASGTSSGTPVSAEASGTVTPHHCAIAIPGTSGDPTRGLDLATCGADDLGGLSLR